MTAASKTWLTFEAPVTVTGVPIGSDALSQPLVSVAAPVPEQWAAWPTKVDPPWVKMKLDVHDAPPVSVLTPGWIGAEAAGAHAARLRTIPVEGGR